MEIYTLSISFPHDEDDEPWVRTIEAQEGYTLKRLHKYIQEIIEFDDDHLYEFFVGRNSRSRKYTVPETTKLNELYPITGYKLYYHFDFGDDWIFEIKKSRKKKLEDKHVKYPVLISSLGINPEQYGNYDE